METSMRSLTDSVYSLFLADDGPPPQNLQQPIVPTACGIEGIKTYVFLSSDAEAGRAIKWGRIARSNKNAVTFVVLGSCQKQSECIKKLSSVQGSIVEFDPTKSIDNGPRAVLVKNSDKLWSLISDTRCINVGENSLALVTFCSSTFSKCLGIGGFRHPPRSDTLDGLQALEGNFLGILSQLQGETPQLNGLILGLIREKEERLRLVAWLDENKKPVFYVAVSEGLLQHLAQVNIVATAKPRFLSESNIGVGEPVLMISNDALHQTEIRQRFGVRAWRSADKKPTQTIQMVVEDSDPLQQKSIRILPSGRVVIV